MSEPLRIALAGLGTVGSGVVRLLEANAALIARRAGRPITITAISARNRGKNRGVDLSGFAWEDDMVILGERPDVDVVVELVGGADGPALALARTTFEAGKALVTANKAMIAHHGLELATKAEAAKGFRNGGSQPPLLGHALPKGLVVGDRGVIQHDAHSRRGGAGVEELARLILQKLLVVGKIEIHEHPPARWIRAFSGSAR